MTAVKIAPIKVLITQLCYVVTKNKFIFQFSLYIYKNHWIKLHSSSNRLVFTGFRGLRKKMKVPEEEGAASTLFCSTKQRY